MLGAELLVNLAPGFDYLSLLYGYSRYNQIYVAEEDVPKMEFQCPTILGTYQ